MKKISKKVCVLILWVCISAHAYAVQWQGDWVNGTSKFINGFSSEEGGLVVNGADGGFYWEVTDFVARDNGFEFPVTRSYAKELPMGKSSLGHWTLEVPRITVLTDPVGKLYNGSASICSHNFSSATYKNANGAVRSSFLHYQGIKFYKPGGVVSFVKPDPLITIPSSVDYISQAGWLLECSGSAVAELIAYSPTGDMYIFGEKGFELGDFTGKTPGKITYYLTEIRTKNGKVVNFNYNPILDTSFEYNSTSLTSFAHYMKDVWGVEMSTPKAYLRSSALTAAANKLNAVCDDAFPVGEPPVIHETCPYAGYYWDEADRLGDDFSVVFGSCETGFESEWCEAVCSSTTCEAELFNAVELLRDNGYPRCSAPEYGSLWVSESGDGPRPSDTRAQCNVVARNLSEGRRFSTSYPGGAAGDGVAILGSYNQYITGLPVVYDSSFPAEATFKNRIAYHNNLSSIDELVLGLESITIASTDIFDNGTTLLSVNYTEEDLNRVKNIASIEYGGKAWYYTYTTGSEFDDLSIDLGVGDDLGVSIDDSVIRLDSVVAASNIGLSTGPFSQHVGAVKKTSYEYDVNNDLSGVSKADNSDGEAGVDYQPLYALEGIINSTGGKIGFEYTEADVSDVVGNDETKIVVSEINFFSDITSGNPIQTKEYEFDLHNCQYDVSDRKKTITVEHICDSDNYFWPKGAMINKSIYDVNSNLLQSIEVSYSNLTTLGRPSRTEDVDFVGEDIEYIKVPKNVTKNVQVDQMSLSSITGLTVWGEPTRTTHEYFIDEDGSVDSTTWEMQYYPKATTVNSEADWFIGQLATRSHAHFNNFESMTYTNKGQLDAVTNHKGVTVNYNYNADGTLASKKTSPSQDDINSGLAEITETYSNYNYGFPQRVTLSSSTPGTQNIVVTSSYDAFGNVLSSTDGNGNRVVYQYDDQLLLTKIDLPQGNDINVDINLGSGATVTYTQGGYVKKERYDGLGRLSWQQEGNDVARKTEYSYDSVGNVVKTVTGNPVASHRIQTNRTYDALNRVTSERVHPNNVSTIVYDGNKVTNTSPEGEVVETWYRMQGGFADFSQALKTSFGDAANSYILNTYNKLGTIRNMRKGDDGGFKIKTFDTVDNDCIQSVTENFVPPSCPYDGYYNSEAERLGDDFAMFFSECETGYENEWCEQICQSTRCDADIHEAIGLLSERGFVRCSSSDYSVLWEPATQPTQSDFQQCNDGVSIASMTEPESGKTEYDVYENGMIKGMKYRGVLAYTIAYDGFNRPLTQAYQNSQGAIAYGYDKNSNITNIARVNGDAELIAQHAYEFDALNNIRNETITHGEGGSAKIYELQYDYNSNNDLSSITYPTGEYIDLAPSVFGEVTKLGDYIENVQINAYGGIDYFDYQNDYRSNPDYTSGQRKWQHKHLFNGKVHGASQNELLWHKTYSYDQLNRLHAINDTKNTLNNLAMTYDRLGRLTSDSKTSFTYDGMDNLLTKTDGNNLSTYVQWGNRNLLDEITGHNATDINHNGRGQMTRRYGYTHSYNNAGEMIRSVKGGKTITYDYDGNHRRIAKYINGELQERYVYNFGDQLMHSETAYGLKRDYLYIGNKLVTQINSYDDIDSDNDGLADALESFYGLNPHNASDANADADGDGVTNKDEITQGLNIYSADSDRDGFDDGYEALYGFDQNQDDNLASQDFDGDGCDNLCEYLQKTNPFEADTDGDGVNDNDDIDPNFNPAWLIPSYMMLLS